MALFEAGTADPIHVYRASKIAAEQAGRNFLARIPPSNFDIVTITDPSTQVPWYLVRGWRAIVAPMSRLSC